jgi:pyridoxal phosphate enzyme (YggS family)
MLAELKAKLAPYGAELIAVSKTHPPARIQALYEEGQRHFGENKVQELVDKQAVLPADIKWHFIGHLQRNKVKQLVSFVHLIHAVDSLRLLREINKRAQAVERTVDVLLQLKIAAEDSKYGLSEAQLREILAGEEWRALPHVRIVGLMGMATFTEDEAQVRREFTRLKTVFSDCRQSYFQDAPHFRELSMGMSGDYQLALECGSTMVRVGSLIFGERNY